MRPGRTFLTAALAVASLVTSIPGGGRAATVGPQVYSTGVLYSPRGTAIPVTAYAICETACAARLYYRTPVMADTKDLGSTGGVSWTNVGMTLESQTPIGIANLNTFAATIPATAVETRGVDYVIRVNEGSFVSYWPGTPAAPGLAQPNGIRTGYWHVYVTNPPAIVHTPVFVADYRTPIRLTATTTCASSCSATLWYRRTGLLNPSLVNMDQPPSNDGASAADEQWTNLVMSVDSIEQRTEPQGAAVYQFSGEIPASHVDTRGVDYALQIGDQSSRMFWPGVGYNGYYYPFDGLRAGWQHVYVQHPVMVWHAQSQYTAARNNSLRLTAQVLCAVPSCGMTLQYNYLSGGLTNVAMSRAVSTPLSGNLRLETFEVALPASAVRTGTLAYRFLASDGHTHAYAPGTFYNGYYLKLTGTPAGQYAIVVF